MSALLSEALVAALFAVDLAGFGGVVLRSGATIERERWLAMLREMLPPDSPWRRVPPRIDDDRLLGGLDLSATLQAGRPVAQQGLLAEANGGIVVLAMAERLSSSRAACIAAALDGGYARFGVIALDEGATDDEQVTASLSERLAFRLTLAATPGDESASAGIYGRGDVAAARERLAQVRVADEIVESLCAASLALGVESARAPILACRAARAAAALDGRPVANADDAALAAGLVLAPRATKAPSAPEAQEPGDARPDDAGPPRSGRDADVDSSVAETEATRKQGTVDDVVLEAALAALPSGLLASLALRGRKLRGAIAGRAGATQVGDSRGRPIGVRCGAPQGGARLNLIETLRAAAPWQSVRRRELEAGGRLATARIQVRREDFHVWRLQQRSETTTVFVVDASGSAALHRLAETKGAVELLLADCYVRRDSVAVISFRGTGAELLLPPTRSLVRAKRSLAGLPGGGATPLAAGIASAHSLAEGIRRRGATPVVVLLTDGRANIARDGTPGRGRATEDALLAARVMGADGIAALLLDTSPKAQEPARQLAAAMGARYLPLPYAGAAALSQAVRAAGLSTVASR